MRRGADIREPASMIAFGSARSRPGSHRDEPGIYVVHPPYLKTRRWDPAFDAASAPERWGYVHPCWNGRAVTGMADRPDWTLRPVPSL